MITIGIPTAGRVQKLLNCIKSIDENLKAKCEFIIINNSKQNILINSRLLRKDIRIIEPKNPLSPSASRNLIIKNLNSKYLFFIDEDMTISEESVDQLLNFLEKNKDVAIVGGVLKEGFYEYPAMYKFVFAKKENQKLIWKLPISRSELVNNASIDKCQSDFIHPPFLIRSNILNKVNFDKNFMWGSELFDFFLSCYKKNLIIFSLLNVRFFHFPGKYTEITHKSRAANIDGKKYFKNKWRLVIFSPMITLISIIKQRLIKKIWFKIFREK